MTTKRRVHPSTRVIVVVNDKGRIVSSQVIEYKGGSIANYYKRISDIANQLEADCKKEIHSFRTYTGTATSVGNFLTLFPEVTSPFSEP